MVFQSLDNIVRSVLLQKALPLHWYVQFLKYAADAVRELSIDSMRVVNTVILTVDQRNMAADLPCDFIDWVEVGVPQGQFVKPLVQRQSINDLTKYTPQGVPTLYGSNNTNDFQFGWWPGYWMYQNIDDLGENLGRLYGMNASFYPDTFKVVRERGQIQMAETYCYGVIVLRYISSGMTVDNATKIDILSQASIEAYIDWKYKLHSKRFNRAEANDAFQLYKIELRRFRARKDDLTSYDIRQAIYRTYMPVPKT